MGPDPPYGAGPGKFPAKGFVTDHQEATEEVGGGCIGVSSNGGSYGGGGF